MADAYAEFDAEEPCLEKPDDVDMALAKELELDDLLLVPNLFWVALCSSSRCCSLLLVRYHSVVRHVARCFMGCMYCKWEGGAPQRSCA